jgi:hypothetical protein
MSELVQAFRLLSLSRSVRNDEHPGVIPVGMSGFEDWAKAAVATTDIIMKDFIGSGYNEWTSLLMSTTTTAIFFREGRSVGLET